MTMNSGGNNSVRVGFIDVLTGFLCSAALLMIIIAYSQNSGKDIAGGSRDYLFYQLSVKSLNQNLNPEDARLQFYITTPDGQMVVNRLTKDGPARISDLFYSLSNMQNEFYAWGPSYQKDGSHEIVYNIYGVCSSDYNSSDWKIDVLYYDHKLIEEKSLSNDEELIKDIVNSKIQISMFHKTLSSSREEPDSVLQFGNISSISFPSYE